MNLRRTANLLLIVLVAARVPFGCSDDSGSDVEVDATRSDGSSLTADDRQAIAFVQKKIEEHYEKGPDGWTTALELKNVFGAVMPGEPEIPFEQYREFKLSIEIRFVSEADKLNGIDYVAGVNVATTPKRVFRSKQTWEGPAGWSAWKDNSILQITVFRVKGEWRVNDTAFFDSKKPAPGTMPAGS